MCGLVAIVNKSKYGFSHNDVAAFELMLFMDTLRGEDSTGVYLVDNVGNVKIAKAAIDGPNFLNTQEWRDIRAAAISRGWVLVGHNRKATRGSVTDENAHPFWVEDKIVLVHNGSMYGGHKHLADTEVDSHAIAHTIATEETVEAALQKINAAYALMWYNVQEKSFNIIRNTQRPLHFNQSNSVWFFTSEESILDFCLKRADVKHLDKEHSSLITDSLQRWTLKEDRSYVLDNVKLDCSFRSPPGSVQTYGWQSQWARGNPNACAWESEWSEYFQEAEEKRNATPQALKTIPALMQSCMNNNPKTLPWEEEISYSRFVNLRQYSMSDGSRIRVVVEDFDLNVGNANEPCFMIARYAGSTHSTAVKVMFPIEAADIDTYVQSEQEIVFYVTVREHHWTTSQGKEYSDLSKGFATIWADNPTKVVLSNYQEHTVQ